MKTEYDDGVFGIMPNTKQAGKGKRRSSVEVDNGRREVRQGA